LNTALAIIAAFLVLSVALGMLARRGRTMSLEQWAVGGRGFGTIFVFLLMAGEIYTTFTFLGASGWAYANGAAAFYIPCYGAIAYVIGYFILPPVWRYAAEHRLLSQVDFFVAKYRSDRLGLAVSLVGVAALLPYLVLQLKGLGIIISEASYGAISPSTAVWLSTGALVGYVVVSGVHGSAWTSVLKDFMILGVAVGLGIYLPVHYYGSYAAMFEAIEHSRNGFAVLSGSGMSPAWLVSTALLSALGFFMWPHAFASIYTARDESVLRRNAAIMPFYQVILVFVLFVGFAAVLQVPGLKGADGDLALLRISKATFSPVVVGVIGAAGLLTALVPGSMLLVSASTILVQNVLRPIFKGLPERAAAGVAKGLVPLVALFAVLLTLRPGNTVVQLLLMGYSLVTQLFPAFLVALPRVPLASRSGALAGIIAGEATVAYLSLSGVTLSTLFPRWPSAITDVNVGMIALLVNVATMIAVTLVTRERMSRDPTRDRTFASFRG
jgi:SSS family solute:Na+ symporter